MGFREDARKGGVAGPSRFAAAPKKKNKKKKAAGAYFFYDSLGQRENEAAKAVGGVPGYEEGSSNV